MPIGGQSGYITFAVLGVPNSSDTFTFQIYMYCGPPCMMHNETARCMQCTTTNWSDMERNIFEYPLCTLFGVTMDIECYWHIYYITPPVYRARKTFSSGLMVSRVAT